MDGNLFGKTLENSSKKIRSLEELFYFSSFFCRNRKNLGMTIGMFCHSVKIDVRRSTTGSRDEFDVYFAFFVDQWASGALDFAAKSICAAATVFMPS